MENLDILHFEQLKTEIEQKFLEGNTPSNPSISKWKGIDIVYFQEDLRKKAKGNISEKSFYTYFKSNNTTKLPRIDMLNILSIYAGYESWYAFKKSHLFENEVLENETETVISEQENLLPKEIKPEAGNTAESNKKITEKNTAPSSENHQENTILQKNNTENKTVKEKSEITFSTNESPNSNGYFIKKWTALLLFLIILVGIGIAIYWKSIFGVTYIYSFRDADRSTGVNIPLNIKVIKENESPIFYRIEPGQDFVYSTDEKMLNMEVTSPLYENLSITRNLDNAPEKEIITLRPDDYKTSVYYYSKKSIPGDAEDALEQIKLKRRELEHRISNHAVIYQVFDNNIYGIETLDKEKYITLVTTPTTSLKNLSFLDVKTENGKIILIKFKIKEDE
ncbi:hypothetical protein [Bergeyella zoohelcum]|uniref:Uncharacterized protein n=1 Tax=Bergeyella zoohelcum TaxID=1015 RepID=A0A376C0E6_9FLAO|nr:hypothetical protein [Bergeyella zoohelcum]EKB60699.1 hypothetical protein HMPREF9700_00194 [Bergeyella zoohelcum CCUG 30536]SSZ47211.1 Uncharacterised protein [Bergeyella zoohelcum]